MNNDQQIWGLKINVMEKNFQVNNCFPYTEKEKKKKHKADSFYTSIKNRIWNF